MRCKAMIVVAAMLSTGCFGEGAPEAKLKEVPFMAVTVDIRVHLCGGKKKDLVTEYCHPLPLQQYDRDARFRAL